MTTSKDEEKRGQHPHDDYTVPLIGWPKAIMFNTRRPPKITSYSLCDAWNNAAKVMSTTVCTDVVC